MQDCRGVWLATCAMFSVPIGSVLVFASGSVGLGLCVVMPLGVGPSLFVDRCTCHERAARRRGFIDCEGVCRYVGGAAVDTSITSWARMFPHPGPNGIGGQRSRADPLTRYLRETSMIFTTRVAKAMQSIAIAIATVISSIVITSFAAAGLAAASPWQR